MGVRRIAGSKACVGGVLEVHESTSESAGSPEGRDGLRGQPLRPGGLRGAAVQAGQTSPHARDRQREKVQGPKVFLSCLVASLSGICLQDFLESSVLQYQTDIEVLTPTMLAPDMAALGPGGCVFFLQALGHFFWSFSRNSLGDIDGHWIRGNVQPDTGHFQVTTVHRRDEQT